MAVFAVSAIGRDRPGIVAGISEALLAVRGNIEDSHMSILRGHFAVMLIVSVPEPAGSDELERSLGPVRERLDLEALSVNEVDELGAAPSEATHVLTVYGADHPGIVHAVSAALAGRGINITDLETRLGGTDEEPVYMMLMEVALGEASAEDVEAELRRVGREAEVEVSLRPLEAEAL